MADWTFLTNHAHVLFCIAENQEIRLRDVAERVGITERAAQRIVADLITEGYLSSERVGRRNQYHVHAEKTLRHPIEKHCAVGTLIRTLTPAVELKPGREAGRRRVSSGTATADGGRPSRTPAWS